MKLTALVAIAAVIVIVGALLWNKGGNRLD